MFTGGAELSWELFFHVGIKWQPKSDYAYFIVIIYLCYFLFLVVFIGLYCSNIPLINGKREEKVLFFSYIMNKTSTYNLK